ncbi:MAG: Fe(3+) ABC transporter substrate-binding protein [Rhodobacteraceae bacterium]|nr:Fe(3+) ABC transporter substrate-binding protein [Paracoccaceae bacterium]
MTRHFIPTVVALAIAITTPLAASSNEVNVYSYRQPELVQPLFDAFTEATGINVNVAFLNKGMIERLQAEGSRSPADLVMTVDISRLQALVDAGVTQNVDSPILKSAIAPQFRAPDDSWYALTLRARVVYASKERVMDGDVTTYEDLADPKWKGRICMRSGTHPYNLALISSVIAHHGEDAAKAWLTGLRDNQGRKPQGNDRAQVKAVWAGECDIALGNTYYMGKMLEDSEQSEWANSVRIIFPVFDGAGTHVNVSGMAMTKAAPNRDNALRLMEFLASRDAQQIYAEDNYEYPVDLDVPLSALVAGWGVPKADSISLAEVSSLRPKALKLVQEVDFDR